MKATRRLSVVALAIGMLGFPACDDGCEENGGWYDPATELCWQNPSSNSQFGWDSAAKYCEELSIGGHHDWRMPMIQELISLMRGCNNGHATGDLIRSGCEASEPDCLGECWEDFGCDACNEYGETPGPDGCFWDPEVEGTCGVYWSSSRWSPDTNLALMVNFSRGDVYPSLDVHYEEYNKRYVRCVRGEPWYRAADSDTDTDTFGECTDDGEDHFDPADCPEIDPDDEGIRYVNAEVESSGDGLDWTTAVETIQEGIDSARCAGLALGVSTQVWVAAGTYGIFRGCATDTLRLRNGVELYGGFSGTETSVEERDWQIQETILEGSHAVYHVVTASDNTRLDGLTVRAGGTYTDPDDGSSEDIGTGAGVYKADGTMVIANCSFAENSAYYENLGYDEYDGTVCQSVAYGEGGAIHSRGGSLEVHDSEFIFNSSVDGGGIWSSGALLVDGCRFEANLAVGYAWGSACEKDGDSGNTYGSGGAIHAEMPLDVTRSAFVSNGSTDGGAIHAQNTIRVSDTSFFDNASHGYMWNTGLDESDFGYGGAASADGSLTCDNCVFARNSSQLGGALWLSAWSPSVVANTLFFENEAVVELFESETTDELAIGGAVYLDGMSSSAPEMVNIISVGNEADSDDNFYGVVEMTYSLVEGGWDGLGNIDSDPMFIDADGDDFRLRSGSPCIDAANGDAAPALDIDGNARADDPDTINTGVGAITYADMGPYERQLPTFPH